MRARFLSAAVLFAALAATACDNRNSTQADNGSASATPAKGDATFVDKAAIAGMFEVESSRLALQKAAKPELHTFAQMMVDDHSKANDELKTLVEGGQAAGISKIPAEMDAAHQAKIAELKAAATTSAFEAKYQQFQLDGHKQAVDLFETEATTGLDPALKNWAVQTLPTIKAHLARIQSLASTANQ